jgi:hypothetical protein
MQAVHFFAVSGILGDKENDGREMCVHGLINNRRELTVTNMTEEVTSTQV